MSASDLIARVRRAMPRNSDVMALCDALEELRRPNVTLHNPSVVTLQHTGNVTCPQCERRKKQTAERVARHRAKEQARVAPGNGGVGNRT